jgi:hypothetical protein
MLEGAGTAISCNDDNPELEEPAGFEDQAQFVHLFNYHSQALIMPCRFIGSGRLVDSLQHTLLPSQQATTSEVLGVSTLF